MADIDTDAVAKSEAAKREEKILAFWKENKTFEKSLQKRAPKGDFVFYEGPPTANGLPGVHHLESRAFKDAIPRYKTMRGFRVPRRAGWDTHGLPVELEVEKQLGFSGKKDIEIFGIAEFNKKCRESVFKYINEWSVFTERVGYWVDQTKAYFTFDASYMESLFSIVKKIDADGRLYKDYKVLPWCPVCGTALSSHELAQGYEDVKDLSLTAKFRLIPGQTRNGGLTSIPNNTYLLAWTTTPWTLPGNVALAVNPEVSYVLWKRGEENFILAENLARKFFDDFDASQAQSVDTLVGLEYEPLYPFALQLADDTQRQNLLNAFKVYPADFVTTEDGTGIVHTAVMYGQDDFELGQKLGLPKVHLVAPDGKFVAGTGFLEGSSVIDAETNVAILKDLQERGLFFSKENYTHSYPHCWRSKNRLIYYARDSWYIRMTELRDELVAENQKTNWEPDYIRDGRMGEWLANVRDWAISRERYWGTPLPVWRSSDGSEQVVIGSIKELKQRTKKSGNTYFSMRHGEAENNIQHVMSSRDFTIHPLTEAGREMVRKTAKRLANEGIDIIYASPMLRTQQTAELVREALRSGEVITDARLRDYDSGIFEGKQVDEYQKEFPNTPALFDSAPEGGETFASLKRRIGSFLYDLEKNYEDKRILIVSHGDPVWMMQGIARAYSPEEFIAHQDEMYPNKGEYQPLPFIPLPHNDTYELDLHRPYIDDVVLVSDSGKELRRVPEVMDVWFDSGAMPFAEDHYPFENKKWIDTKGFPADFICEAIDQTRGWFYTLLAVGVLMGKGKAYKNVISLGHLLDEKGLKMSKSKGNVIEPMKAIERYGADTLRFWMYSVNQPGDSKNFDDKTVKEAARVISWFENSVKFYELFKDAKGKGKEQVLDRWMQSRVSETVAATTTAIDAYDLYTATRLTALLVEDLSQWYVRRVRDRVREGDAAALKTLRDTLEAIALLLAPFTPFIAEWAYQIIRSEKDPESVHMADWPKPHKIEQKLNEKMRTVRGFASEGLRERQKLGIVVRQPIASVTTPEKFTPALAALLAEEVNAKKVLVGTFAIDTVLTPELIREGDERTFARAVAEARKTEGFSPKDVVHVEKREDGMYVAELSSGAVRFSLTKDAS